MDAKVTWQKKMTFDGTATSGFNVNLGTTPNVGGDDDGFRPLELMLVGLAGCTAMDVISILQKKREAITSFEVEVQAEQAKEHPKVFTKIHITYRFTGHNIDARSVERAIELSETKYCPAQAMMAKIAPIEHTYTITPA
ncbi:MAG: OsmC family protein [Chloroflexaceae bacterium]|nr:OsmC family protein [Chloroflexaceae bacterium]